MNSVSCSSCRLDAALLEASTDLGLVSSVFPHEERDHTSLDYTSYSTHPSDSDPSIHLPIPRPDLHLPLPQALPSTRTTLTSQLDDSRIIPGTPLLRIHPHHHVSRFAKLPSRDASCPSIHPALVSQPGRLSSHLRGNLHLYRLMARATSRVHHRPRHRSRVVHHPYPARTVAAWAPGEASQTQ